MNHPVIPEIVDQHAEEVAFLWLLRDRAALEPHFNLDDLTEIDERLESNLEGLRVAGEAGWETCLKALASGEPGEVFAAAIVAFESQLEGRIKQVAEIGSASLEASRGLASSLGWLSFDSAEPHIRTLLDSDSPMQRRAGIAAYALHRRVPAKALSDTLASEHAPVRARALRAVGELGKPDHLPALRKALADKDSHCRFWAAYSLTLLTSERTASEVLQTIAASDSPCRERAALLAVRKLPVTTAAAWRVELAQEPRSMRIAVLAAGALGIADSMLWLMEQMRKPELARVAGEAFSLFTGVNIVDEKLEGNPPENFQSGPTENPEDDNVALDPDENLPWPNPEAIARWWERRKSDFTQGKRYLFGKPVNLECARHVLHVGSQRQRAGAALELALLQPGKPLFEVRAPGFRQRGNLPTS